MGIWGFWRCCCVGCKEAGREFPRGWTRKDGKDAKAGAWEKGGAPLRNLQGPDRAGAPAEVAFLRFRDLVS